MEIVLDTSVIIALIASEAERNTIIEKIDGKDFICPESVMAEIGNAISAMFKRNRITLEAGKELINAFQNMKIKLLPMNLTRSIEICDKYNIYAYDSYALECAERLKSDLATLDKRMKDVASELKISIVEV